MTQHPQRLTLGKIRGLTQLSDQNGIFSIVACDQRGALRRMMAAQGWTDPTYDEIAQLKQEIIGALSPHATGVLLDPEYGVAACVSSRTLHGNAGLVVALEETGYEDRDGDRISRILDDWSVEKIKAIGASAVKLLVYFNARREQAAAHQVKLVQDVAKMCRDYDIPLMLECLVYPTVDGQDRQEFLAEKEALVLEAARILSSLDIDLYKVEFPLPVTDDNAHQVSDEQLLESCAKLDEACASPWALLSAGVGISLFERQLKAACQAGASGFVCGRAIWKEAVTTDDTVRRRFVAGEMPQRLLRLNDIASTGRAWYDTASHQYDPGALSFSEWYRTYPAPGRLS